MLIHLIVVLFCTVLISREFIVDPLGNKLAPGMLFIFVIGIYSLYRLNIGALVYKRIRDRGWDISLPTYFLQSPDFSLTLKAFIPEKETFESTPSHDPKLSEWENLREAVLTAQGWDREKRDLHQLIPLYQTRIAGIDALVLDLLKQEGFIVEFRQSALRSTYGNQTIGMGEMIYVSKAHYDDAREFLEEYFQENEEELAGLQ